MSIGRAGLLFVLLLALGCRPSYPQPHPPTALSYAVEVASTSPWLLDVTITLANGAGGLELDDGAGVVASDLDGKPITSRDGAWVLGCSTTCRFHYRYDLSRVARDEAYGSAMKSGSDVLAPGSTWLARPRPMVPNLPVRIDVKTPSGVHFATGLHRDAKGTIEIASHELDGAAYTAFGSFTSRSVKAKGGTIDVAVLSGARSLTDAQINRWVGVEAAALDQVYDHFPVERVQLFLVPIADSDVIDFGRTLPSGGASIAVTFGAQADERVLYDDWILSHEMFHLGVPSFFREGRWFDEGLATYYEPVVRTRAGLRSDKALWHEFAKDMRRGLPDPGDRGLVEAKYPGRVYWGGAMFVMQADLAIRERTHGAKSLDDGLRGVLHGGDATRVWSLKDYFAAIDRAVGVPVLEEMYAPAARTPSACPELAREPLTTRCLPDDESDLIGLFKMLGVGVDGQGEIVLRDDAPLATMRREMLSPVKRP